MDLSLISCHSEWQEMQQTEEAGEDGEWGKVYWKQRSKMD